MEMIDLSGMRFSNLVVIKRADVKRRNIYWLCKCDCGNQTIVRGEHLKTGNIKSCGCMHHKYGHGQTETRLYHIWCTMKARCYRETSPKFSRYGGRGIIMCEAWKNDFTEFYKWAHNNGYDETLSIDRIDNDGNYCPENCKWSTPKEQANNTSSNVIIEYKGETGTVAQMAIKHGLKPRLVYQRIHRGWSVEKALETERITTFFGNRHFE